MKTQYEPKKIEVTMAQGEGLEDYKENRNLFFPKGKKVSEADMLDFVRRTSVAQHPQLCFKSFRYI